ncbi:MAG: serine hydrolase domain-containing protein [Limnochordia bacterium]
MEHIAPVLLLCLLICFSSPLVGAAEPYPGLESLCDEVFTGQLRSGRFVGAAVSVVKDGRLIFAKGYGFADLEQNIPVNPYHTVFRIGSVTKLFTWTAVMQLVEQGKIGLHDDVNAYLDFTIAPHSQQAPITMWHLMTHTAGFADSSRGMLAAGAVDAQDLGAFLAQRIPAVIYPPGRVTAYSNYGTALAGYILEQVTRKPYEQVIDEQIFQPLQMTKATLRQPPSASGERQVATGYAVRNGKPLPQPFENIRPVPSGGASATVIDMSHFMIAHLQAGRFRAVTLLDEETVHEMHARQFQNDSRLTGMALGFYQIRVNGRLFLTHAGDTTWFSSQMFLLPSENLGIFVSYNARDTVGARQQFMQAFCARYYPDDSTSAQVPQGGEKTAVTPDVAQIAGSYLSTRRPVTGIEKLRQLIEPFYQPIKVIIGANGLLRTINPSAGPRQVEVWEATASGLYERADGQDLLAFTQDDTGQVFMLRDSQAPRAYQKMSAWERILYNRFWPLLFLLVFAGLFWVARHVPANTTCVRFTHGIAVTGILTLLTLGYFGLCQFTAYLHGGTPISLKILPLLLVLNLLCTLGLAAALIISGKVGSIGAKLPYLASVLLSYAFHCWAWFWQLYQPM